MLKRSLFYKLSPKYRFFVRKLYFSPVDFYEGITGKREKYIPKKGDIFIGPGDFKQKGQDQLSLLKTYIALKPNDKVLDIGSGMGRTAIHLTKYLNADATYDGFDVVKKGVNWCQKTISKDFSNFKFQFVPLNNDLYNQYEGKAENFKFPYQDNLFDKSFLFSVFTHMRVNEIDNYLKEIHRVLKIDGMCLATFFIYRKNEDLSKFPGFKFPYEKEGYRLLDEKVQGANIALEYSFLEKMIQDAGLEIEQHIVGFWRDFSLDRKDRDFQDVLILKKK
ncbi:class I SAM-dependent methyltransferase [Soonwooa sp.]|uniref:class I SAM-dependent methyltransferase n=1 Tax=Soonwooa sp. TaxID=1938592 RepID=UPI0028ABEB52|nr:class I SAM-dependent methyltransferase [Soonwooa sp.]